MWKVLEELMKIKRLGICQVSFFEVSAHCVLLPFLTAAMASMSPCSISCLSDVIILSLRCKKSGPVRFLPEEVSAPCTDGHRLASAAT